jgi:hypothetical protein
MFSNWLKKLALYYCREILICEREAAITNLRTLKAGRSGLIAEGDAIKTVESSLVTQITALEALMGASTDELSTYSG